MGEQIGIYVISQKNGFSEKDQQIFAILVFVLGFVVNVEYATRDSRLKRVLYLGVEIFELILYITTLPRIRDMLILSLTFFALEFVLHAICFVAANTDSSKIYIRGRSDGCLCAFNVGSTTYFYGLLTGWLLSMVFLKSGSKFRDQFFEILLVLVCFGAVQIVKLLPPFIEERLYKHTETKIPRLSYEEKYFLIYQFIICGLSYIPFLIAVITAMVYAGIALQTNMDGTHIVTDIDRTAYGFAMLFGVIVIIGTVVTIILLVCCTPDFVANTAPQYCQRNKIAPNGRRPN